jgi:protease I
MQKNTLDGLRVAILVTDDFEQAELVEPKKALEQAGATTKIISLKPGQVQGVNHDVKADTFPVDMTFDQASPSDFDAVLLPGGALNADTLRMVPQAQEFVRQTDKAGKPIAVICHAPWLLVSAGLVKGKTMTSYYTIQDDIRNAGANWVDQEMVRDGNWVSSRSPKDLPAFNPAMIQLFSESKVTIKE